MSSLLPAPIRWIVLPLLIVILGVLLFSETKRLIWSLDVRSHWIPTRAHLTQIIRQGKGIVGEYHYTAQGTEYSGVVFGGPVTLHSKIGDEIQIWVHPDEPILSGAPDSLLKIPFVLFLLLAEIGCIGTIWNQYKRA